MAAGRGHVLRVAVQTTNEVALVGSKRRGELAVAASDMHDHTTLDEAAEILAGRRVVAVGFLVFVRFDDRVWFLR